MRRRERVVGRNHAVAGIGIGLNQACVLEEYSDNFQAGSCRWAFIVIKT